MSELKDGSEKEFQVSLKQGDLEAGTFKPKGITTKEFVEGRAGAGVGYDRFGRKIGPNIKIGKKTPYASGADR